MDCPVLELRPSPEPGGEDNQVVLLMRLQRCEDPEALREWFGDAGMAGLGSAFAALITRVRLPELGVQDTLKSDRLAEVLEMLKTDSQMGGPDSRRGPRERTLGRFGSGAEAAAAAGAGPFRKGLGAKHCLSAGTDLGSGSAGEVRRVAAGL